MTRDTAAPAPIDAELMLQQVCDSVFPIGAYSHSYGLETYIQLGLVHDEETAGEWIGRQIRFPLTYTELLGMRVAYDAAAAGDIARITRLEADLAALKAPFETRSASEKLAARFIRTVRGLGALTGDAQQALDAYAASRARHAVNAAYGTFAALAGIGREGLLRRWLYTQASGMVVNAVKSVPLSQTAGQKLLFATHPLQATAVRVALTADESLLGLSMPGFDIRCIEHETLYSRLFMS